MTSRGVVFRVTVKEKDICTQPRRAIPDQQKIIKRPQALANWEQMEEMKELEEMKEPEQKVHLVLNSFLQTFKTFLEPLLKQGIDPENPINLFGGPHTMFAYCDLMQDKHCDFTS